MPPTHVEQNTHKAASTLPQPHGYSDVTAHPPDPPPPPALPPPLAHRGLQPRPAATRAPWAWTERSGGLGNPGGRSGVPRPRRARSLRRAAPLCAPPTRAVPRNSSGPGCGAAWEAPEADPAAAAPAERGVGGGSGEGGTVGPPHPPNRTGTGGNGCTQRVRRHRGSRRAVRGNRRRAAGKRGWSPGRAPLRATGACGEDARISESTAVTRGVGATPPPAAPCRFPAVGPPRVRAPPLSLPRWGEEGGEASERVALRQSGSSPVRWERKILQAPPSTPRASPQPPQLSHQASARLYLYHAGATAPAPSAPRGGGPRQPSAAFRGRRGAVRIPPRSIPVAQLRSAPPPAHRPSTAELSQLPPPPPSPVRPFPGCPRLTHILHPRPRRFPAPPPTTRGGAPRARSAHGAERRREGGGCGARPVLPPAPPEPPPPHVGDPGWASRSREDPVRGPLLCASQRPPPTQTTRCRLLIGGALVNQAGLEERGGRVEADR